MSRHLHFKDGTLTALRALGEFGQAAADHIERQREVITHQIAALELEQRRSRDQARTIDRLTAQLRKAQMLEAKA